MYLIGYLLEGGKVKTGALLKQARRKSGLTQAALAQAAGTSRTTLSAYEHGHKSPTLETAERLLEHAGYELALDRIVEFTQHPTRRGRSIVIPTTLPRLPVHEALATITLPLHLNWSTPQRTWQLAHRPERARVYEVVLSEGTEADIKKYVDGLLLVDLWEDLVLPQEVRNGWNPLVHNALAQER